MIDDTSEFDVEHTLGGVGSVKWDHSLTFNRDGAGADPMWIAELDFAAPPPVRRALMNRAARPNFGYTWKGSRWYEAVESRFHSWGWRVEREWISFAPGVMNALATALEAMTMAGDRVIVEAPAYPPLLQTVRNLGRAVVLAPLALTDGRYRRDFDVLDRAARSARVLVLCNPHNPTGRSWQREDMEQLEAFCLRRGVSVISDEAHADLVLDGDHVPLASISAEMAHQTVTCVSPGKGFAISGMKTAVAVLPDSRVRNAFVRIKEFRHLSRPVPFGPIALEASWLDSLAWLDRLKHYLRGNRELVVRRLARVSGLEPVWPEASFIQWLDCRALRERAGDLRVFFRDRCGILVSDGGDYGREGDGFVRVAIGMPRRRLAAATDRIVDACGSLVAKG